MANRTQKRLDRIKKEIHISRVLSDFGYGVRADAGDREQQFSCDLHGDGKDRKPSARSYDDHWYCFACDKARDAVETTRAKMSLGFMDAIQWLEEKYGLPSLPWEAEEEEEDEGAEVRRLLDPAATFEDDRDRLHGQLSGATVEKSLPMDDILAFWDAYDRIVWMFAEKKIPEDKARAILDGLNRRLSEALAGGAP